MQNKSDLPDEWKLVKSEMAGITSDGTLVIDAYCVGTKTVDHIDVTIDVRQSIWKRKNIRVNSCTI